MSSPGLPWPTRDVLSGGYLSGILSSTGATATGVARAVWAPLSSVLPVEDAEVGLLSKEPFLQSFCPRGGLLDSASQITKDRGT